MTDETTATDVPQPEQEAVATAVAEPAAEAATTPEPAPDVAEGMAAAVAEGLKADGVEVAAEPLAVPAEPAEPEANSEGDHPEAKAADPAKPEAGGKPDDATGAAGKEPPSTEDEIKTLGIKNERAQARFRELRDQAAQVPALQEKALQYDQMLQHITATGATPQQFQSALSYLNIVNNGSPEQLAQMRETLLREIDWIDGKIGAKGDVLAQHADLKDAVENGEISREYAVEIARQRSLKQAQQQYVTQQTESQQRQQQERDAAVRAARDQLNSLGQRLQASDPHYAQRVQQAMQAFKQRMESIPPAQWATEFLLDYQAVQMAPPAAAAAPASQGRPPITSVPLRSQGAGAMGRQPASMEEAMMLGLQSLKQGRAA